MPIVPLGFLNRGSENAAPVENAASERSVKGYKHLPPMREDPSAPDQPYDSQRVQYVQRLWHAQDSMLRGRDRQVEENVRMLCGQQWAVWSEVFGKFVDITDYLTDEERRWRQFPVMNRILLWYMLVHARMTENPPVVTFQPATLDAEDAQLAEVMDTVFKTIWNNAGMLEVLDRVTSWLIPGGSAYLKSRIDLNKGDLIPFIGQAPLTLLDPSGSPILGPDGQPIQRMTDGVPFDADGQPLAEGVGPNGEVRATGSAYAMREGAIAVDALSPLELRGEWGSNIPWHDKRWHIHRTYVTPEQFYETYGWEHPPEITGAAAEDVREFQRLIYGSGFFGAADQRRGTIVDHSGVTGGESGYIEVMEMWMRPCDVEGMRETMDDPGGRVLTVTRSKCVKDTQRYARFKYTSPIRQLSFVHVPGRPQGTSPQEMLNGPARSRNRMVGQILQHTNLVSNPLKLVDRDAGIVEGQLTNRPGQEVYGNFSRVKGKAVEYVRPADLGNDVYKILNILTGEFDDLGNVAGAMGSPPTTDASGELVKELRFNADRFIGPTQRRSVVEMARMVEDWMQMVPIIWDQEKVLRVAGSDNIVQTISVYPEMFKAGNVDVVPDIESMLPEGRGERQSRALMMYERGLFGQPGTPEAINRYMDLANFPHMGRATRPGGEDFPTAEQNVGKLLQGVPAASIPIFDWYDKQIHLSVLHRFMKSPAYLKQPVEIQQNCVNYRMALIESLMVSSAQEAERQATIAGQQEAAAAQALAAAGGGGQMNEEGGPIPQGPPDRGPTATAMPG